MRGKPLDSREKSKMRWNLLYSTTIFLGLAFSWVEATEDAEDILAQGQRINEVFTTAAARIQPAVVAIVNERAVATGGDENPFQGTPFEEFFAHRQSPDQGEEFQAQGQGSGVIVRYKGDFFILTNDHVVRGADKIGVELSDGRSFLAEVVGTDPKTDLAVLRIEADDLPTVKRGDSDRLKVGEWVLAAGNPFGLHHTVTSGIVSAVGRGYMGLADYEDFIQTDAAINPGNSGGALVNLRGELVGINTAIFSRSGGNQGIGFAIPINMASNILKHLVEYGEVRRGQLGVYIKDVDQDMAEAMGLKSTQGVLVDRLIEESPAERAGLQPGDVVLKVNGETMKNAAELRNEIAQFPPDFQVKVRVWRDGKEREYGVKLGGFSRPVGAEQSTRQHTERLGLRVIDLTAELARRLGYEDINGVLIVQVRPGSSATRKGLQRGDVILQVNRKTVTSVADYEKILGKVEAGDAIMLLVLRENYASHVALRMPK